MLPDNGMNVAIIAVYSRKLKFYHSNSYNWEKNEDEMCVY